MTASVTVRIQHLQSAACLMPTSPLQPIGRWFRIYGVQTNKHIHCSGLRCSICVVLCILFENNTFVSYLSHSVDVAIIFRLSLPFFIYYYYYTGILLWWQCHVAAAGPPYKVTSHAVSNIINALLSECTHRHTSLLLLWEIRNISKYSLLRSVIELGQAPCNLSAVV